jgi:predicted dehydrogenase
MEHLMTTSPIAAIVGAGAIAPFHIEALRTAGFNVVHISARPDSPRATELANRLGIPHVWSSAADLITSGQWDALVLASSTESIPDLIRLVITTGKPCLVEKPVGFDATTIREFVGHDDQIRVAYNRRFYATAEAARKFASAGPCIFRLELPESVGSSTDEMNGLRAVKENSVHGFDFLAHILGQYRIEQRLDISDSRGRLALASTDRGDVGMIVLNWNCPANFSLVLDHSPQRFEVKPFELATSYEGMEVLEPTTDMPVRRYVPKVIRQVNAFPGPDGIKPGFLDQARSLMSVVQDGQWDSRSATMNDAAFATAIAQSLTSN